MKLRFRAFSTARQPSESSKSKDPRPDEGVVDRKRHINEAHQRFQRLVRWEIVPLVAFSASLVIYFKFQTEFLNYVVPTKLLKLQPFSDKEERFIARKLSGLLSATYTVGHVSLRPELLDYRLVDELYGHLLDHLHDSALLPASVKKGEVILFYSDSQTLFILPNGALYLSESLLSRLLEQAGVEGLGFALLHELAHIVKKHSNLGETHKYGDLRRQYFMFENQYIGFDALFTDYFTNQRYTLD